MTPIGPLASRDCFDAANGPSVQAMDPIHTGNDTSPRSNMIHTTLPRLGTAVDPLGRHGIAQPVHPGTAGTVT